MTQPLLRGERVVTSHEPDRRVKLATGGHNSPMFMRLEDKPDDWSPFQSFALRLFIGLVILDVWLAIVLAVAHRVT